MRQLHEYLPVETAAKEQMICDLDAEIATRQASIAKDQERVEKLGQKEVLQANEEKRLGKYRVRIAKKVEDLKAIQEQQAKQREAIRQRAERLARGGTQECNRGRRVRTKNCTIRCFGCRSGAGQSRNGRGYVSGRDHYRGNEK